jgi:hypothetical protein
MCRLVAARLRLGISRTFHLYSIGISRNSVQARIKDYY